MEPRPIVHIELPSADAKATEAFYSNLFGWKFEHAGPPYNYTMFQAGNTGGGLIPLERAKPGEIYVYIQSEDVEADLARIEAAGGKIVEGRMEIPNMGAMAVFEDPTGNKLALWQSFNQE